LSKQPVHIYGDSFVAPVPTKRKTHPTWYDLLAQDYEVLNYGMSGTGPDYSITKLEDHRGQFVIFFTGFPERYSWKNIPEEGHAVYVSDRYYRDDSYVMDYTPVDDLDIFCEKHGESIKYAYKSLQKEILRRTQYVLGYLRNYADIHKAKVIAVCQQNQSLGWSQCRDTDIEQGSDECINPKLMQTLNTKYFSIYPYDISKVSRREIKGIWDGRGVHDTRRNHLTYENHVVLYKNIISILEHTPFEEHVSQEKEFSECFKLKPKGKFIYDE